MGVQLDNDSEKLNSKFRKIRGRRSLMYFISFAFCEILNILSVVACMASLNALLDGQYMTYGHAVQEFYANTEEDRKSLKMVNPMCNVFPTEVSCDVASGGIPCSASSTGCCSCACRASRPPSSGTASSPTTSRT